MGEIHEDRDEAERRVETAEDMDEIDPPMAADDPDEAELLESDNLDPEGDDDPEAVEKVEDKAEEAEPPETADMAARAKADQAERADYAIDDWKNTEIEGGTRLYRLDFVDENGENGGGEYFITEAQSPRASSSSWRAAALP